MIFAERRARLAAEAAAAGAQADLSSSEALIAHLKLEIEKLRRTLYGARSERAGRLLDQLEFQLEELEAAATEDELAAERTQTVRSFRRKRPMRKPFPDAIQRERIVIEAPRSCPCCGGSRLSKLGEDVTETLEVIPRQWKVIEELEASATADELAAVAAAEQTQTVRSFQRKRPVRKPFPEDIQRERVVIEAPICCPCCGGRRLSKLGEDVTETLEVFPRQWKVIETVREKFTCRDCEAITQPPAPFHATPRGFIGPKLLAMILFDKFAQHIPLNRQSQRFKCEGIDLGISTLADQVGAGVFAAMPLYRLIEGHVLAAERLHGDDTTVPPGQGEDHHRPHLDLSPG